MKTTLKHIIVLFFFMLMTCMLLYPLPLHLSNGLLAAQSGDPLMQVWVVHWNIHKLTTSLANYFDANIFYPYPNTFAYHDHLFALGLVGLPIFAFTQNPILTYNFLLMLAFILSAYGMYLLGREITHNDYAAFLAGLIFGFLPYRFAHLDHLNLLSIQWLPFCLLFLTRYCFPMFVVSRAAQRSEVLNLVLFWLFFLLQALTSFNYLFMLLLAVGVYIVATLFLQWKMHTQVYAFRSKQSILLFIVAGCIVGLLLLPFTLPYLRANREMGFQRTIQEAESLSVRIQDYFVAPEDNLLYGKVTQKLKSLTAPFPREQILFYGILPSILAILGIWGACRRETKFFQKNLVSYVFTYFILFIIAGMLSLGPTVTLLGKTLPLPYKWLYQYVPGFKALRVPARFGLLVFFALTVLAAIGFFYITDNLGRYKRHINVTLKNVIATGLIGGIILLEYFSSAKQLSFYPGTSDTIPPVYQWLADQPEETRIIELPVRSAQDNFEYAYFSTFHWKRMVNGRSAFIPNGISQVFGEMRNFPSLRTVDLLKCLGIQYVILHTDRLDSSLPATLPDNIYMLHTFESDLVLEIAKEPSDLRAKTAGLNLQYHLPLSLQPDEFYTIGVSLKTEAPTSICPLPQEKASIQITWLPSSTDQAEKVTYQESRNFPLPLLIQREEPITLSMNFKTPSVSDDYQVTLNTETALFAQKTMTKHITISPDVLDSQRPGKLRAEFVKTDIPDVWERGKPLPVRVLVKNTGETLWRSRVADRKHPVGEVHLGVVDWREVSSGVSLKDSHQQLFLSRGFLPYDVALGEEVVITAEIRTPDLPGEYFVEFDMVSELIQWFSAQGSTPFTKAIILK